jgi:cystathionine beta-lyase
VGDLERVARVKLSEGAEFSESTVVDTASFVRINFATDAATDAATLTEILRRVGAVLLRGADPRRG